MSALTKKQQEVLSVIKEFVLDRGIAPSVREIMDKMGVSSPATIHQHVGALTQKGFLKKTADATRNILPTSKVWKLGQTVELPLIGLITAGEPIEAVDDQGETIAVPAHFAPKDDSYVLKVKGESMIDEGILNGDYVIVERNFYPKNGDVVVALLNNEYATLKKFFREKNRIRLQPANTSMKPIFAQNPAIQGVVKGLMRNFAT